MGKDNMKTIYKIIDDDNNGLSEKEKQLLTDAWMCFLTGNGVKHTVSNLVNTILYILVTVG